MHCTMLLSLLVFSASLIGMHNEIVLGQMNLEVANTTQKKYWVSIYNGCGRDEHSVEPGQVLKKEVVVTERHNYYDDPLSYGSSVGFIHKSETKSVDQLSVNVVYQKKREKLFGSTLFSHPTQDYKTQKQLDNKFFETSFPQADDFTTRVCLKGDNLEESTISVTKSVALNISQLSIRSTAQLILQDRMNLREAKTKLPAEVFEQAVDWMEKIASPKLHQLMLAYLKS